MFRRKRLDTTVRAIENLYGVVLNARSDMLFGNLLSDRGFDSLTQLLTAYRGSLTTLARKRRLFLSFHAEDLPQVKGFRLMAANPRLDFDFFDGGLREPVASERAGYVRQVIRRKIEAVSVVACLIGNGTAWRDWVDWELNTAFDLRKGLCGIRLKSSRGRTPPLLVEVGAPIAHWDVDEIIAAIECAAARRS
jgi:hypothetical protein